MARTITHSSSGGTGKKLAISCSAFAGFDPIAARDEAQIDAGVLRLLEALRVKEHAHGGGDMGVVRLGAVIIDPLLDHAERSARIDLRRLRCMRRLYQHERRRRRELRNACDAPDERRRMRRSQRERLGLFWPMSMKRPLRQF